MSTQHPDNVATPFFADNEILSGNTEVKEAYYVFSQLGCREQMWDSEGKDVDNQVVEKLLSSYTEFFNSTILGKDVFLTYRVPNPTIEKNKGKILLEVLHSIPRAFDSAKLIHKDHAPIFEIILPMTTNELEIRRISTYYEKLVVGQQSKVLIDNDIKVSDWIGEFKPEKINIIPLFENFDSFLNMHKIVEEYLKYCGKGKEYQRVFLARSDPALNYGSVSAVLLAKIARQNLHSVEEKTSIPILPILGVGSAPFRGNLKPTNIDNCPVEYPSVQTFTIQSAFKYDYSFRDVINSIDMMNSSRRRPPLDIDDSRALKLVNTIKETYQKQLYLIADTINSIARFIPSRRARKLHVGLFGYSRSSKGISLPRAITFCASFYSLGLPPELLGLSGLNNKEVEELYGMYINLDKDLKDSLKFLNLENIELISPKLKEDVEKVLSWVDYEPDHKYCAITSKILKNLRSNNLATMKEDIEQAAWMRKFLG
ncbi:MAG: phosphoenolpyruvate carboxylase [Candidatus ainarchaeum sp.]|nr:phosphoenolpyruvate carboxylase [Candidatus ainarchaeum sp.]